MSVTLNGHLDVVKLLVEHGADLSLKDNEGKTAAMIARENGHNDIADYLDPLTQFKERMNSTGKSNDGSLALKPEIRGILRTEQEYNVAKRGVSYVI